MASCVGSVDLTDDKLHSFHVVFEVFAGLAVYKVEEAAEGS